MDNESFFNWIILPILIFLSRMCDVTLATLRHIFVSKGFKKYVPVIGFFEVLIWLIAMRQIFNHLNNAACFIAWAGGFSMGTLCGMWLEEKLALGMQIIRVITNNDPHELCEQLKLNGIGFTLVNGEGALGPVKLIFLVVKRKDKQLAINLITAQNPQAFYSIEDVRNAEHGVFASEKQLSFFRRMFPEKAK